VAAAWAQIGRFQDCTALVTNALAAVGVRFHGWPAGYLGLGHVVGAAAAVPGDIIYYANGGMGLAHVAVYAGQGLAIHGGWNGNQTVSFSAYVGSGPVFIRVH
jgi:cell wall-associated NlpC family hydrolase